MNPKKKQIRKERVDIPLDLVRKWIEVDKKTKRWISKELGVSIKVVSTRCAKYNIKFCWPIEEIRRLVEIEGLKHWEVGDKLGLDHKQVSHLCAKNGVNSQRRGPRGGENHPDWKGGRTVTLQGYVMIYTPGHPYAKKPVPYVQEHRLVMEKHLGRYLRPGEVVHHLNKVKTDNRIENLKMYKRNSDHLRVELKGKTPNWTEGGKQLIREKIQRSCKSQKEIKFCDALMPQTNCHQTV